MNSEKQEEKKQKAKTNRNVTGQAEKGCQLGQRLQILLEMPLTDPQEKEILKNAGPACSVPGSSAADCLEPVSESAERRHGSNPGTARHFGGGRGGKEKNRRLRPAGRTRRRLSLLMMCGELQEKSRTKPRPEEQTETGVSLRRLIASAFTGLHRKILEQGREYVLKGGRGSGKSSFVSVELWLTLLRHPNMHAVVLRRVGNTLRSSVFTQLQWAAGALGIEQMCRFTLSPMEAVYEPTGQKILFFGMDDPGKLKSLKVRLDIRGCFGLRSWISLKKNRYAARNNRYCGGRGLFTVLKAQSAAAGAALGQPLDRTPRPGRQVHHSDYTQMPASWLGEKFWMTPGF